MTGAAPIKAKDRDAILQSLRAGVVPRVGQRHIQVGRALEVQALLRDVDRIAEGGSAIRFVIGEYGSGKTFFLNLVRSIALERKLVAVHADLTPDRRLQSTGGQARALYAELMRNLSTRAKPDGGALSSVVERFVTSALAEARTRAIEPPVVIQEKLHQLSELVGGYDFAEIVAAYWRGHDSGNEQLKSDAVRWLRAEFSTRTDARNALGVRTIIDDENFYDHLKLMGRFVRLAGFGGLLVSLDEMVNLYKLAHTQARNANYEQILRILNDSLQGVAVGLGFVLGGTPDFLMDTRRGLYSYQALQSRLAENTFATGGLVDFSGPVIRLTNLTAEDLYVLLGKIRDVHTGSDPTARVLPDDALTAFMAHCSQKIGDAYFRTPRNTVTAFVNLLAVLEQNPSASWQSLIGDVDLTVDTPDELPNAESAEAEDSSPPSIVAPGPTGKAPDELATFKL